MTSETSARARTATLLALGRNELEALVVELGGRTFHARDLRRAVVGKGLLDYELMTSLPAGVRAALRERLPIFAGREIEALRSADRTTKLLIEFDSPRGAPAMVETVHIPPRDPASAEGATLCVSTQVGCPIACPFCASGRAGLERNLEAHEIVEQFIRGRALGALSRSVVMGIGEPLLNYENLARALEVVRDEMGMGSRKITVSTVGFPERVRRIAPTKPRFQLAISLHTPDQEQRDELVPAMKGVPIAEVVAAADDWFEKTGREVTYEYVVLAEVNDTRGHADRMARLLQSKRCTVNLIPYNPIEGSSFGRPSLEAVERFQRALVEHGIVATVRWSRGVESDAACGQLRTRHRPA